MIKLRQQGAPMAVEYLANEEEILLLVSYQQHSQNAWRGLEFCRGRHGNSSLLSSHRLVWKKLHGGQGG
jgi:hypothetical protein